MHHIASDWGGKAVIPASDSVSREFRLMSRAYAEVYGIEMDDAAGAIKQDGRLGDRADHRAHGGGFDGNNNRAVVAVDQRIAQAPRHQCRRTDAEKRQHRMD